MTEFRYLILDVLQNDLPRVAAALTLHCVCVTLDPNCVLLLRIVQRVHLPTCQLDSADLPSTAKRKRFHLARAFLRN